MPTADLRAWYAELDSRELSFTDADADTMAAINAELLARRPAESSNQETWGGLINE